MSKSNKTNYQRCDNNRNEENTIAVVRKKGPYDENA